MSNLKQINPKNLPHNENKIIRDVYYKSRNSYEKQRGFFRMCFNQVRENKESKYKKVDTRKFQNLIEEMIHYEHMEYICAGLNSFEREVVVIDCDDEDRGKKTLELLMKAHLEPHLMKVKSNGHSQFYFFIKKFYIGEAGYKDNKYYENDFYNEHHQWKWLNRMMNVLFNGDIGYTGYNCQNPFFKDAEVYEFRSLNNLYTVDFLCRRINHLLSQPEIINNINETIHRFYSERKQTKNTKKEIMKHIHFLDEEEAERLAAENREELRQKLAVLMQNKSLNNQDEVQNIINEIIKTSDNSINKRIFVLCSKICKSFWSRGLLHNPDYDDEIIRTCISNWCYEDDADGYTNYELVTRIKNDVYYIKQKDIHNTMLWNKVGYTLLQREKSLKSRQTKMNIKRTKIYKLLNKNSKYYSQLSFNKIAELLTLEYNNSSDDKISLNTVKNYLMMKFKNNILYFKKYIQKQYNKKLNSYSYIHNNKLVSVEKKDVVKYLFCDNHIKSYDIFAITS